MGTSHRTRIVVATLAGLALAGAAFAQLTTYEIKRGEVIGVEGNDLVVRTEEGVRQYSIPESFRFAMDGQQLSVHQLKPGMLLTAAIETTEIPIQMITTELRNAEVINATGMSVVVRNQDGEQKIFTEKDFKGKNLAIYKNGKPATAFDLRKGDLITALILTEGPPIIIAEKRIAAIAEKPTPPAPPAPASAVATATPVAAAIAPPPEKPAAKTLPKTGSAWPLVGISGLALLGIGIALTAHRRLSVG